MEFINSNLFFILISIFFIQLFYLTSTQEIDRLPLVFALDNILLIFISSFLSKEIQKILLYLIIITTTLMTWIFITERIFDLFSVRRVEIKNKNFIQVFKKLFFQEFETLIFIFISTMSLFYIKEVYGNFKYIAVVSYIMANIGILYILLFFTAISYSSAKYDEKIVCIAKNLIGKNLTMKIQDYNKKISDSKIRLKEFILKSNKDEVQKFIEEYVTKIDENEIEYIKEFTDINYDENGVFPLKNIDYLMSIYDFICSVSQEEFSDKESDKYELGISHSSLFWGGIGYFMNIRRYPNTDVSYDFVGKNSLPIIFFINCVIEENLAQKNISEIVGLGILQIAFFQEINKDGEKI